MKVFATPVNLEAPVNSSFDDVYYTLNDKGTEAYFSSNRIGSLFLDESFEKPAVMISTGPILKKSLLTLRYLLLMS